MANYTRDGIEVEIPDNLIPIIKGWSDKADSIIESLQKDKKALQGKNSASKRTRKDTVIDEPGGDAPTPNGAEMDDDCMMTDGAMEDDDLTEDDAMEEKKKPDDMNKDSVKRSDYLKLQKKFDSLKGEVSILRAELASRKDSKKNNVLRERLKLQNTATKFLPTEFNSDSLLDFSDRQIKETVITTKYPALKDTLANRNDGEVNSMFDVVTAEEPPARYDGNSTDSLKNALNSLVVPDSTGVDEYAYLRSIENNWKS